MQLKDKAIIITGSAGGIGRAIAHRCVQEGAQVLITDRHREGALHTAEELAPAAAVHIDDLEDSKAAARIVEAAVQAFGRLDGIVNNAAYIPRSNIETTDATLFDAVLAVNVRAPMLLIQAGLSQLAAARGCVLNIGSINAYCGEPPLLAYSVSGRPSASFNRYSFGVSTHPGLIWFTRMP